MSAPHGSGSPWEGEAPPEQVGAVSDPGSAGRRVERIIELSEEHVGAILEGAKQDARKAEAESVQQVRRRVKERRDLLQALREDLIDRASELAHGFEALLDNVEAAEADLTKRLQELGPEPRAAEKPAVSTEASEEPAAEVSSWRRRWWRRRLRRVA